MKEKKNTLTRRRKWPPSQPAKQGTRGVTHNSKLWPRRTFFPSATRGGRIATVRSIVLRNCGELPLSAESSELYIGKLEWMEGRKEGNLDSARYLGGYTLIRSTLVALSFSPRGGPFSPPPLIGSFQTIRARRIRDDFAASI